jgi:hypothetical protein
MLYFFVIHWFQKLNFELDTTKPYQVCKSVLIN